VYKRILLAYDGSAEGRTALREGALIARRFDAQVFLLSVISETAGVRMGEGVGGEGVLQQQGDYRAVFQEGLQRLQQFGFQTAGRLVIGEPAREIGAYAGQFGADLVVVGHRRQSAFERWWSGPHGAYLVDHVRCSVLVSQNILSDEAFRTALADAGTARGAAGAASEEAGSRASATPRPDHADATPAPAGPDDSVAAVSPRRRRVRWALFLFLPLVLLLALYLYVSGGAVVSTDDAYVEARTVGLSTDVPGIVRVVAVRDNQPVRAGDVLFRLDDEQFRYALDRSEAQLGNVANQLLALQANYRQVQTQIREAQIDVEYQTTQFRRAQNLQHVQFVSRSAYDLAHRTLLAAQQKLTGLQDQLASIGAQLGNVPNGPLQQNPRYLAARAQRDEAARELAHTVVRAPFDGTVTRVSSLEPGRFLPASTTGFYLVDTDAVWITAMPKETDLTYVRAGQPVTVHVDTYPRSRWRGTVASISPAAAEQFSLLPAQNTSGNWVKVVQRIPLRVRVDASSSRQPPLRAGMSVEIDIDTGHARGWPWAGHAPQAR
jgi:membrane fusion protein (multidrug efflux system)